VAHYGCRGWWEAARAGRARESTGSGRLVLVSDAATELPAACPWCHAAFYLLVRGERVPTREHNEHREITRAVARGRG